MTLRLCHSRTAATAIVAMLLLGACASKPPKAPLTAPDWPSVPAPVLDALCNRLRMDAIATGAPLAIVSTTRPLATQQSLSSLIYLTRGRPKADRLALTLADANRTIPVTTEGSSCAWRAVTPAQLPQLRDEMVIELSAPALHPFAAREGGLFARATVGGEHASWYWISLYSYGDRWAVGGVSVLSQ
jgi:hypothetical protein